MSDTTTFDLKDSLASSCRGKVTYDGEPLAKIRVVFNPIPVGGSAVPGPYSTGVTDEEGNFSLETRAMANLGQLLVRTRWGSIGRILASELCPRLNSRFKSQKNRPRTRRKSNR